MDEITARNLLPISIRRDERSAAFAETLWSDLDRDLTILLVYYVDRVNPSALPHLAAHLDVLGYKGWILARNDLERRELLKIAFELHRYAGTRHSLKLALSWLGFDQKFEIEENPGNVYDGLSIVAQDGRATFGGSRIGQFSIRTSGQRSFSLQDVGLIVKLIDAWKPTSRHLFDLYLNDVPVFRQLRLYDGRYSHDGGIDYSGFEVVPVPT